MLSRFRAWRREKREEQTEESKALSLLLQLKYLAEDNAGTL
jgi:hypothetical protein